MEFILGRLAVGPFIVTLFELTLYDESWFWIFVSSVIIAGVIIYCTSKSEEQKKMKLKTDKPESKKDDKCLSIIGY